MHKLQGATEILYTSKQQLKMLAVPILVIVLFLLFYCFGMNRSQKFSKRYDILINTNLLCRSAAEQRQTADSSIPSTNVTPDQDWVTGSAK